MFLSGKSGDLSIASLYVPVKPDERRSEKKNNLINEGRARMSHFQKNEDVESRCTLALLDRFIFIWMLPV